MNLINKLKNIFSKKDWMETPDLNWENYKIQFEILEEEQLLEIAGLCRTRLTSENSYTKKSGLNLTDSIKCQSLDSLIPTVKQIWETDFTDTHKVSNEKGWIYRYYVDIDEKVNQISLNNVLKAADGTIGNVIYSVLVIKKIQNEYYCWNLLE
ncbi:hypothetical protein [Salinimicrobium sp. TH3]|uniref:hypothetical protein n=1 Tax=Salinimicrobium sp. TH3 TaxID=2997342 RepID=UPI002276ACE1|nr:hypothetical protein [Salinimicrobium sp. TH3]MCY2686778.1 hypothetical protein [Salinimicrobium sp. TH3]